MNAPLTVPRRPSLPLPLPPERLALVSDLLDDLDPQSLQWLSGYAAGLAAAATARLQREGTTTTNRRDADAITGVATTAIPASAPPSPASLTPALVAQPAAAALRVTILYGTQTGNSRRVAASLSDRFTADGVSARLVSARDYPVRDLAREELLVLIISTHGEGDPPDDARDLYELLTGPRAPKLPKLHYAVLGLGDSSYAQFCGVARVLDEKFAALGATRVVDRADADVDFAPVADLFAAQSTKVLGDLWRTKSQGAPQPTVGAAAGAAAAVAAAVAGTVSVISPAAEVTIQAPATGTATVLLNQRLTGPRSLKAVHHLELGLPEGMRFQPGDALLVHGTQHPEVVEDVLRASRLDGDAVVTIGEERKPLRAWLAERELTRILRPFAVFQQTQAIAADDGDTLAALLDPKGDFDAWARRHQLVDLLHLAPARWTPEAFVAALRPLAPRAYSIANSCEHSPGEAHLTVAIVDDHSRPRRRRGVLSANLGEADIDTSFRVEIQENRCFRLPADPATDVIFVGPGTGIAPFRSFLQERDVVGATGRHWLFFGDQTLREHFLYQTEWQEARRRGLLHRLDVAWSRDQKEKRYVQHLMLEQAADLWAWLDGGASFYVCGDARRMAKDVEAALLTVARTAGGLDDDGARQWLRDLSNAGRYCKDVY